jgi:hypothetical protein
MPLTPVPELARRCSQETKTPPPAGQDIATSSCLELFYLAFCENNLDAYQALVAQYQRLFASWLKLRPSEDSVEWTNEIMRRLARANPAAVFRQKFTAIRKLMAYLKLVAQSVSCDHARRVAREQIAYSMDAMQETGKEPPAPVDVAQGLEENEGLRGMLAHVRDLLSEQQYCLFRMRYMYFMKPAEITDGGVCGYTDSDTVYRDLEEIKRRLRKDPILRDWLGGAS